MLEMLRRSMFVFAVIQLFLQIETSKSLVGKNDILSEINSQNMMKNFALSLVV